jgi:HTH-type transcriptional regulator/antitoxin HigA
MTASAAYKTLLAETAPQEIRNEAENDAAIRRIEELEKGSAAERKLADLLTVLVEAFEEEHYPVLRKVTPVEVLKELMEANGLKQKDLTDIFVTPSIVSEVLSGKRNLTIQHIKRLSKRFHIPADLFF